VSGKLDKQSVSLLLTLTVTCLLYSGYDG